MCVINPMKHRGRGLHGVVPLRRTVVCQGRGARLRTAVMLFSVLSVASGGWLSVSWRGAELRTVVWGMFGREANLAGGGASSGSLRPSERRESAAPESIIGGPTSVSRGLKASVLSAATDANPPLYSLSGSLT